MGTFASEFRLGTFTWGLLLGNFCLGTIAWFMARPTQTKTSQLLSDLPRCFWLATHTTRSISECFYGLGFPHVKEATSASSRYSTDMHSKDGSSFTSRRRGLSQVVPHWHPRLTTNVRLSLGNRRLADFRLATFP